jgi:subtilisin family serine protease
MKRKFLCTMSILLCTLIFAGQLAFSSSALSAFTSDAGDGEAVVMFEKGASSSLNISGVAIDDKVTFGSKVVAKVTSTKYSTKQLVKLLNKKSNVKYATANIEIKASSTGTSSVEDYTDFQWALNNTGQNGGTKGSNPGVSSLDTTNSDTTEQVIAVLDTGVDYTNDDLKDVMWENPYTRQLSGAHGYDFVNDDSDPMDDNGHGSHCAGIIAAQQDDNSGVSGVAGNVKIMAIKILGSNGGGDIYNIVKAYNYIYRAQSLGVNIVAINNSWGSSSEGVEEEYLEEYIEIINSLNDIATELFDAIGKRGAISVFAAGNETANNDTTPCFPSSDSKYLVSVAATNETGDLAEYSNYGDESVDVAAPGSNILSTYSSACYNPSIYSDEKSSQVNSTFYNFNDNENGFVIADCSDDDATMSVSLSNDVFFGKKTSTSASAKLSVKGAQADSTYVFYIPYTTADGKTNKAMTTYYSCMIQLLSDEDVSFGLADVSKSQFNKMSVSELLDSLCVNGTSSDMSWSHLYHQNPLITKANQERYFVVTLTPEADTDIDFYVDDLATSKWLLDEDAEEVFGKYEFESGTSMATPYVTGCLSVLKSIYPDYTPEKLITKLYSYTTPMDNIKYGRLDFVNGNPSSPIVLDISQDEQNIVIEGDNFGTTKGAISIDDKNVDLDTVTWEESKIVVPVTDINNKTVNLSFKIGDKTFNQSIYIEATYSSYQSLGTVDDIPLGDKIATNGKYIYVYSNELNQLVIYKVTSKGLESIDNDIAVLDYNEIFKDEISDGLKANPANVSVGSGSVKTNSVEDAEDDEDDDFEYDLYNPSSAEITSDLCYVNNKLYAIAKEYCNTTNYYKIICYDISKNTWSVVTGLPDDAEAYKYGYNSLASYNGNLYLAGGYSDGNGTASTMFRCYNLTDKKWSEAPSLPTGRYGSTYRQVGDKLVAVYGADSNGDIPKTAVFDGTAWTETVTPPKDTGIVKYLDGNRSVGEYTTASCSITKEGLIFTAYEIEEYGDTFTYNVSTGEFAPVKYTVGDVGNNFVSISLGDKYYVLYQKTSSSSVKAKCIDINSPYYKVSAGSGKYTVSGTKYYTDGETIKITVKPSKNYYIKSVKINGTKISGTTYTCKATKDIKVTATTGAYVTKVKLNKTSITLKAGNKKQLKATVTPKNATSKKVTWKTSNKKYATVNSKGVVTAKKAGKGKTVKITATASDRKTVKATCKVKIK